MKYAILWICLMIAMVDYPAVAQITINAADYQKFVGQHVEATEHRLGEQHYGSLTSLTDAIGADKTYDFTPYAPPTSIPVKVNYHVVTSADGTPGANIAELLGANFVYVYPRAGMDGEAAYSYFDLKEDGLFTRGTLFATWKGYSGESRLDTGWSTNAPHERSPLPLTMGSSWTQSWVRTSKGLGAGSDYNTSEVGVVEGWGTLVTPAGSAPALRVKRTRTEGAQAGLPKVHQSIITSFETGTVLMASIVTDTTGRVLGAQYTNGTGVTGVMHPSFNLRQNIPNPFTGSMRFAFSIEHAARVTLKLFDIRGSEIATLIDGPLAAGEHMVSAHTGELTSGLYLYRLQVESSAVQRQFVVQR